MSKGYLILGGGGHGKVIADMMLLLGMEVIGFLDDSASPESKPVMNLPVLGKIDQWAEFSPRGVVMAIGHNPVRRKIVQRLEASAQPPWVTVIHPTAILSPSVVVEEGTVIMGGVVINVDTHIGRHSIVNTSASVDHDCQIGDFVHLAPGVHLAGSIHVEEGAFLGVASAVIPGRRIGKDTTIGAGAVVVRDVPAQVIAKGVPARWQAVE